MHTSSPSSRLLRRWPALAAGWLWRLPHQTWALVVCALALLFGVGIADDYGIWVDTYQQRAIGEAALRHLAGESGFNLLSPPTDRLYGPVFEAPLRLVERLFEPDDGRGIYLARRLLTHLFFLAAGVAGYLLAYRLFGNRWLALFALLLFLLHPRIYAHSFFNSKDVPFLGMFMICLWLAHRAFDASRSAGNGSAASGAFALCGIAAGLLINMRIAGLAFFAILAFARLCDVVAVGGWNERRRVLASVALFAFASVATYYATMPFLWADPVERFGEILAVMLAHPVGPPQLFQGDLVGGAEIPASYLPVWFGVTTPPLAMLLGGLGFAALLWRIARRRLEGLLGNTPLRFDLLVAACFVLPVLAAIVLRPTLHSDWRHFYFLWAPFVLLATSGLRVLAAYGRRFLALRISATVAAGAAALGLGAIAWEIVRLHPHQNLYFNVLANRFDSAAPLRGRFHLDDTFSRTHGYAQVLYELGDELGDEETRGAVNVWLPASARRAPQMARLDIAVSPAHLELFRQRDRRRLMFDPSEDPDFYVRDWRLIGRPAEHFAPNLYERRLYGEPIVQVATPDLSRVDDATGDAYRSLYRQVRAGTPALRGDIDVYRSDTAIVWVKEHCVAGDLHGTMQMTVFALQDARPRQTVRADGVRIGDACLWQAALPDYPIARIIFPAIGVLATDAHLEERRRQYAALVATSAAARSVFDVYWQDGTLVYVKTPCVRADTEAPFFVHIRPEHLGDIRRSRRPHGFEALDFRFGGVDPHWHHASGDIFDDVCMATLELPDYPIAGIATGQYARGGASLWRVDVGGG